MTDNPWLPPQEEKGEPPVPVFTRRNVMTVVCAVIFGAVLGAGAGWFLRHAKEPLYEMTVEARVLPSEVEKERTGSPVWVEEQKEAVEVATHMAGMDGYWERHRHVTAEADFDPATLVISVTLTSDVKSSCESAALTFFNMLEQVRSERAEKELAVVEKAFDRQMRKVEAETDRLAGRLGCEPQEKFLTAAARAALAGDVALAEAHTQWKAAAAELETARVNLIETRRRYGMDAPRLEITKQLPEPVAHPREAEVWGDYLSPALKGGVAFGGIAALVIFLRHKMKGRPRGVAPGSPLSEGEGGEGRERSPKIPPPPDF